MASDQAPYYQRAVFHHQISNSLEAVVNLIYLANMDASNPEAVRRYMIAADVRAVDARRLGLQSSGRGCCAGVRAVLLYKLVIDAQDEERRNPLSDE
jgi:hypothetical protein